MTKEIEGSLLIVRAGPMASLGEVSTADLAVDEIHRSLPSTPLDQVAAEEPSFAKEQTAPRLLRVPAVTKMTTLSRTEIHQRVKRGTFPKPLKLGQRAIAWSAEEVENWINNLVKQSRK